MNETEAKSRFVHARVGRLATVRPDGTPHVVPFVFAVDGSTVFWAVDAKPKSSREIARLANIASNPAVEAVVDSYDDHWERLWWVRATGRARTVTDPSERAAALDLLATKYPPYRTARPAGPVIAVQVERWTWWEPASSADP